MFKKNTFRSFQIGLMSLAASITSCQQSATENNTEDGFVKIFDGKTYKGWAGDTTYWKIKDNSLVGEITPDKLLERNSFIIWEGGELEDFELKLEYRITENGNSGINYRSEKVEGVPYALKGYQADIDGMNRYTGQNYEERGRTTLAYRGQKVEIVPLDNPDEPLRENIKSNAWTGATVLSSLGNKDSLKTNMKFEGWNECHLIVKDNRLQHFINGVLMSDVTDNDTTNRKMKGLLGVQVHVGPPMKVEYKNIRLKQL